MNFISAHTWVANLWKCENVKMLVYLRQSQRLHIIGQTFHEFICAAVWKIVGKVKSLHLMVWAVGG